MSVASDRAASGLLVERNPNHPRCKNFRILRTDLRFYQVRRSQLGSFDAAVLDAPWYPNDLLAWVYFALSCTHVGGNVFFVLWPEETRPTGKQEQQEVLERLSDVGRIDNLGQVSYELPPFEVASLQRGGGGANFFREGVLYSLKKQSDVHLSPISFKRSRSVWRRYTFGSYQLAIKIDPSDPRDYKTLTFDIAPHILENTSRRNSEIRHVNIWGSNNIVAKLNNPRFADLLIRRLIRGCKNSSAMDLLELFGALNPGNEVDWRNTWQHLV
ncbi:hypothetical protein OOZ54_06590 [Rhodopseudomonas palustris]|uniref:hypothetical protein n=1 Tax=Rhodopseudomonas palustris TaxID=1076 RepID=UPI0022EFD9A6|nr:hypothetical protein [Rhodopseudomonas palustris]WBU31157.1 hypothetical protein OOZ54_06590 [Rhodopseudomonas palustris]